MKRLLVVFLCMLLLAGCGQKGPTWREQYDLGVRYLSDGDYEKAILAFAAAIEIDPKQPLAYVGRGDAYIGSGETEENLTAAQADYDQAIELDAANAEAYLGLADVYIRRAEYDQALNILQKGLEKTGGNQIIADKLAEISAGNFEDSSGNLRRMQYHDEGGNVIWWHDYVYNALGQKISMTVYDAVGNQVEFWDGFKYDEHGNCVYSPGYSFTDGTVSLHNAHTYADNQLIRTNSYDSISGELNGYQENEYDTNGKKVKTVGYDRDGTLSYTWIYTYDGGGNWTRVTYYDAAGTSYGYDEHKYDETGELTGYYQYDSKGELKGYVEY